MISSFGFCHLLLIGLSFATAAQAAERVSVEDWKKSYAKAVSANDTSKLNKLTDFARLEKVAVPACVDCNSKKKIHEARELFQNKKFAEAEKLYNEIPKGSDLWLQAVEERGWSHFRRDNYEKTLAQTKTLLSPQFIGAIDTEAYFLQSLTQLRMCDYEGVLKTHQMFKEKQRDRIVAIQALAETGENDALKTAIAKIDKFPVRFEDFGESLTQLPLLFYRDIEFQKNLLRLKVAEAALKVAPSSKYNELRINSYNKIKERIKDLAQAETADNAKMIQKLNLIEVETIQRIHTDMQLAQNMYKESKFQKTNSDQLVFEDDGQPWIDELDKYEVVAKTCAKNIRRKM
jgi:hypothetical protein